jgi:small subunit ribosomal protein S6
MRGSLAAAARRVVAASTIDRLHPAAGGGKVHRVEDWGRRQMAYMIQKLAKAHYLCINIECGNDVLNELETSFRFNDAVLRHLTVQKSRAETTPSVMMKTVDREEARKAPQEAST